MASTVNLQIGDKMKTKTIKLRESTIEWVAKRAEIEGVPFATMVRLILEREEFRDEIKKQLDEKKRG